MDILDQLGRIVTTHLGQRQQQKPVINRAFRCRCEKSVFFRNDECLSCYAPLGYHAGQARLAPLIQGTAAGTWTLHGDDTQTPYRRCANFNTAAVCNWLVVDGAPQGLCKACELNRYIPDQSTVENQQLWAKIEVEKRRLVSQLLDLGLPVESRVTTNPDHGLAFDFLRSPPEGPRILTGHANGIVTLNAEEADDATREKVRAAMREPYRTLLGHLRHEVGHYYWDRLIWNTPWLNSYRSLFGDERASYTDALRRNYEQGPPMDWSQHFVSAYASTHPWEDWAETWAHFMHMEDAMDTALSFGLDTTHVELNYQAFTSDALWQPQAPGAAEFLVFINAWLELTSVLNELSRSMGEPDFYPFVLNRPVVAKLQFIHNVIWEHRNCADPVLSNATQ